MPHHINGEAFLFAAYLMLIKSKRYLNIFVAERRSGFLNAFPFINRFFFMNNKPIYVQIYQQLKREIAAGSYVEGDLLPSENELCNRHNSTRMTVRKALQELVQDGYIYRKQGKGSIVSSTRKSLGLLSIKGWTDVVAGSNKHGNTELIEKISLRKLDTSTFQHIMMEVDESNDFHYIKRLRSVDNEAIMLEETYVPSIDLPGFENEPLLEGSLFKTLYTNYGIDVVNMVQEIRAVACNQHTAALLNIPKQTPMLHILRRYNTSRNGCYLYSSIHCDTNKFAISGFN
jgi:DNA-binding GntR family transcriptional regulator